MVAKGLLPNLESRNGERNELNYEKSGYSFRGSWTASHGPKERGKESGQGIGLKQLNAIE